MAAVLSPLAGARVVLVLAGGCLLVLASRVWRTRDQPAMGVGTLDLANLVRNAVQHNDADEPRVGVSADVDADRALPVRVTVADSEADRPEGGADETSGPEATLD
jgi:hypothetical protein